MKKKLCSSHWLNTFFGIFLFYAFPLHAATLAGVSNVTALTMIENIAAQIPILMQLVTAIGYVMGFLMVIRGVVKLKHFGEMRTQMSQELNIMGPILTIAMGAMLIYLPSAVQVGMSSFWAAPNPYGYLPATDQWTEVMGDIFLVVELFGTIAFMRGLVILSHLGEKGQPGEFARGITHIIGGIFCINLYQFVQMVMATLGIQLTYS